MEAEEKSTSSINITPLVDVALTLVLIFMVTMPISMIHGIDVKRQILQQYGLSTPQDNVSVHLTDHGIYIKDNNGQDRLIPYEDFGVVLSQMIKISSTKNLLLKAERDVPHGQAVWVLDIAKQNGARDISMLEGGA